MYPKLLPYPHHMGFLTHAVFCVFLVLLLLSLACSIPLCLLKLTSFKTEFIFSEEFSIFPGRFTNTFLNDTRAFVPVASRVRGWWDEGSG